jgi:pimeloyl-ACP methyl ester carboxylesterase
MAVMATSAAAYAVALTLTVSGGQQPAPDTTPHTEHYLDVDGARLHYLDYGGTGEPLMLLTGYGPSAHVFDAFATRFTNRFRVVALTRRGTSPSSRPAAGYDLETLTADILATIDALKLDRVHLVAHSLGGAEATQLATTRPDRVASIVYLDAALDAAPAEAIRRQAPVPNPQPQPGTPFAQVQEWWTRYRPDFSKVDAPMLMLYAIQEEPPLPPNAPPEQKAEAEAFWREAWLPFARNMIDRIRRTTPTARVVVFENTSHYLFRDREADVIREMVAFYDRLEK